MALLCPLTRRSIGVHVPACSTRTTPSAQPNATAGRRITSEPGVPPGTAPPPSSSRQQHVGALPSSAARGTSVALRVTRSSSSALFSHTTRRKLHR
eukprot:364524-Chlamydomonas_euryale.AAC.1